jgi:hypothetical protein
MLPAGYALVADVEIIKNPVKLDDFHEDELYLRIGRYFDRCDSAGKPGLSDMAGHQFIKSRSLGKQRGLWLVDIEPKLDV